MTRRAGWTEEDRARAIGLGLTRGAIVAAEQTGISRRTISRWLASPEAVILRRETREQVAERLWSAVAEGVQAVTEGLRDPQARLSDKASALRVVIEGHALISGGPTARTETVTNATAMTGEEIDDLRRAFDQLEELATMSDDDLKVWLLQGGLADIRHQQRQMLHLEAEASDG